MHIFFQIIIQTYNSNNWSVVTTPEEEEVAVSAVFVFPDIFWKHVSTNKKLNPDLNLYDTDTLYKTWQNSICSCENVNVEHQETNSTLATFQETTEAPHKWSSISTSCQWVFTYTAVVSTWIVTLSSDVSEGRLMHLKTFLQAAVELKNRYNLKKILEIV